MAIDECFNWKSFGVVSIYRFQFKYSEGVKNVEHYQQRYFRIVDRMNAAHTMIKRLYDISAMACVCVLNASTTKLSMAGSS